MKLVQMVLVIIFVLIIILGECDQSESQDSDGSVSSISGSEASSISSVSTDSSRNSRSRSWGKRSRTSSRSRSSSRSYSSSRKRKNSGGHRHKSMSQFEYTDANALQSTMGNTKDGVLIMIAVGMFGLLFGACVVGGIWYYCSTNQNKSQHVALSNIDEDEMDSDAMEDGRQTVP